MEKAVILIVDDHKLVKESLVQVLEPLFSNVRGITNPNLIVSEIQKEKPDIILLDMNFSAGINSGNEGLYWLREIRKYSGDTQVISITAYGDIQLAVKAIREGAYDFIQKPWENEILIKTIRSALELKRSKKQVKLLKEKQVDLISLVNQESEPIIGNSLPVRNMLRMVEKAAPTDANILITGENGTGKGLLARLIHSMSDRKEKPFVEVDLGALPDTLFESELFGHKKGAFTDARKDRNGRFLTADTGTLFLDEVANIPVHQQARLLTAIQTKQVTPLGADIPVRSDIRLITATNRNLREMVAEDIFREDLFFRINTIEINVPPLRERLDDLALLSDYYLDYFSGKYGKKGLKFSDKAWNLMISYYWPGNIRELKHHIEKAVILCDDGIIRDIDLGLGDSIRHYTRPMTLEEIEKRAIIDALGRNGENVRDAADELKISRQTLYNKIEKYGIK